LKKAKEAFSHIQVYNVTVKGLMKKLLFLFALLLAGCATSYQPQGFTGGYSDFLTDMMVDINKTYAAGLRNR